MLWCERKKTNDSTASFLKALFILVLEWRRQHHSGLTDRATGLTIDELATVFVWRDDHGHHLGRGWDTESSRQLTHLAYFIRSCPTRVFYKLIDNSK